MVSIGPKPVLQYIIESLAEQHFDDITITTNYLREQVENYFGDGSRFGVTLRYPREDKPLGTAGSVKNAKSLDETFAVVQGDNITDISMLELFKVQSKESTSNISSNSCRETMEIRGGDARQRQQSRWFPRKAHASTMPKQPSKHGLIHHGARRP
jgi:NDP-sugar pyrophosphorylase family protein